MGGRKRVKLSKTKAASDIQGSLAIISTSASVETANMEHIIPLPLEHSGLQLSYILVDWWHVKLNGFVISSTHMLYEHLSTLDVSLDAG